MADVKINITAQTAQAKAALDGLDNFPASPTPDTFPATPRRSIGMLLVWLIGEISAIITEDDELPNA